MTKKEFNEKNDWYDRLLEIAAKHRNSKAVQDFYGCTSHWKTETPEEAYYKDFPEHKESE